MKRFVLLVAVLGACRDRHQTTGGSTAEPAIEMPTTVPVESASAGYVGVLNARDEIDVTSPFATNVAEVYVKIGDVVKRGDKLARLDDRPLKEQLAQAKAELRSIEAEVRTAMAAAGAARAKLERDRALFNSGDLAKATLTDQEFATSQADAVVERARANVAMQQAKIAALARQVGDTTIISTIDGEVSLRHIEPGGRVEPGRPIVRVISVGELYVKFAIPVRDAGTVKKGDPVEVVIESADKKLRATVTRIAPELDPVAGMLLAEAELVDKPVGQLARVMCRIRPMKER